VWGNVAQLLEIEIGIVAAVVAVVEVAVAVVAVEAVVAAVVAVEKNCGGNRR
jgi:hypothetical protein